MAPSAEAVLPAGNTTTAPPPMGGPSMIPLTMSQGAVVAPDLDYTVVFDMLHRDIFVNSAQSQRGGVVLGVSSPVGPTSLCDIKMGQLNFRRLLVCARNKLWWMTPEWRKDTSSLPPETQFLLAEMQEGGPYALVLPLIDGDFRGTIWPVKRSEGIDGEVLLRLESGSPAVTADRWEAALYLAASWDPYELVDRGVAAAAAMSGGAQPRTAKEMPASLDGFGWCTWDAFYSTVSARGLAEGLEGLAAGGIRPHLLIIDDGWQLTDVDPTLRKTPTAELAEKLHVEGESRRLIEATQGEFLYETQEAMAETAAHLPAGTSAGNLMPTLSNLGPKHHNVPTHSYPGSTDVAPGGGADGPASSQQQLTQRQKAPSSVTSSQALREPLVGGTPSPSAASSIDNAAAPNANGTTTTSTALAQRSRDADDGSNAVWVARVGQKIAGWIMGIATAAFLIFYQWVVEPAPPNSLAVRLFASAAQGVLRPAMLSFFSNASDFTRRLISVRANGKFSSPDAGPDTDWFGVPESLGTVVAHIKHKFGVKFVYCWHGLPGYWAGVMPAEYGGSGMPGLDSNIKYASPTPGILYIEPSMAWNPAVLAGIGVVTNPDLLYNSMHSYLQGNGVDGVKVDCQAGVGLIGTAMGGGAALSYHYQMALERSVAQHFRGNHVINCMCHSTENLYRMSWTAVARASDDFYPRDPASSQPHIAACAYNSLFLGALLQPDWDMFHSKHPAARLHGIARAVSGGPVYVSDKPGEHDFELLRKLVLPDGSVLRGNLPGRPTRDCLFADVLRDGKSLLKAWNLNAVTGTVAVLHLQGSSWDRNRRKFFVHDKNPVPLTCEVRPVDVDSFRSLGEEREYVVHSHNTGRMALVKATQGVQVSLCTSEADMLVVSPLERVGPLAFAPVGLATMYNGGGAVRSCTRAQGKPAALAAQSVTGGAPRPAGGSGSSAVTFTLRIKGCGDLLLYSSREPDAVLLNSARLQRGVSYSYGRSSSSGVSGGPEDPLVVGEAGRLVVDLPQVSDLENEVQVVYSL